MECNIILYNLVWFSNVNGLDLEFFLIKSVIRKKNVGVGRGEKICFWIISFLEYRIGEVSCVLVFIL